MSNLTFQRLIIRNFKSFNGSQAFKLDRGPGLIYVSGRNNLDPDLGANGVGKTTLWDALTWCLFGKTGRDNKPGSAVVPWGSKKETCVILEFSAKGHNYILTRKRNPNLLMLVEDEDTQQTLGDNDSVEAVLGISEAMFRRTIVLAQFGTLFLDLKPDAQSQMFNAALNLDVWLDASEEASKAHKHYQGAIESLNLLVARDTGKLEEIKSQIVDTKKASAEFERTRDERLEGLHTQLAAHPKADYATLSRELVKLREDTARTRRVYDTELQQRRDLQPKLERINKDIKTYTASLRGEHVCPECGQKVTSHHLKDKLKTREKEFERIENEIAQMQQPLSHMEATLEDYEKKIAKKYKEQEAARQGETIKTQIDMTQKETNQHTRTLEKLRTQREQLKTELAKHACALQLNQALDGRAMFWRDAFKEIRLSLIDQVLAELSMAATAHAEALGLSDWHIEFATERETAAGSVSVVFNVLLFPPDREEAAVRFESYSGGESQRWQLAVAFALSEIVLSRAGINPNIEVYDEPTRGLSSDGIEMLLEHLRDRAQTLGRTIYLTDHHSLERGQFDSVVTIEKTEAGSAIIESLKL